MDGWSQIQQASLPPANAHDPNPPIITTHAFDDQQDLLWVGDESGRITSLAGVELRRYTSYRGHLGKDGPVKQLLFHDRGVISVGPRSVHLSSRAGLTHWHIADAAMKDLRCMSFMGKGKDQLLVAGCQGSMFKIDIAKGTIIDTIPTEADYTAMKAVGPICAATSKGTIHLLDANTLQVTARLNTRTARINDMDGRGNYLVTCCWINNAQGTPKLNVVANVWDVARKEQLSPIAAQAGAAFVQLHPRMSTTCIICSQHGQLHTMDLTNPVLSMSLNQVVIQSYVSGMALAPSGEALAVIDGGQYINLLAPTMQVHFARFGGQPLDWGSTPHVVDPIDADSVVPLNSIGMPFYRERLLSAWSSDAIYEVGHPLALIDSDIADKARPHGIGGLGEWAPNPKKVRRNQVPKTRVTQSSEKASILAPKFLSVQAKEAEHGRGAIEPLKNLQDALRDTTLKGTNTNEVPAIYQNVEIKYSRYGIDDFDFSFYNQTKFSGLEIHIANSYNNPLLQLLHFIPLIRSFALNHTAADCRDEVCLLCELGFLFDALEKAEGKNCQATNLLKTFSSLNEANTRRLLEEQSSGLALSDMLQSSSSLILDHIVKQWRAKAEDSDKLEQAIALEITTNHRCVTCNTKQDKKIKETHTILNYSLTNQGRGYRHQQIPTFSQVLKNSIQQSLAQSRGYCTTCGRYGQPIVKQRTIESVPEVLVMNAGRKTQEAIQCWTKPNWLPSKIGITLDPGKFTCFEGEDLRLHLEKGTPLKVYDLVGYVADITSKGEKSHMVSLIDVAISAREPSEASDWHLFNDFLVSSVPKEDAMRFVQSWKMPSVLAYQASTARHTVDDSWKANLDTSLLYRGDFSNLQLADKQRGLNPAEEILGPGFTVAIDSEFVTLQQQEIQVMDDGNRTIVRPTRYGLGRVSVVRGEGEHEGVPFIDDYLRVQEPIVDHLTKFSGFKPGDLDPNSTPYRLIPRKLAYKKVWLLSNLGCTFIGHGLKSDFRTINIYIPRAQIIDTLELFYIESKRRLIGLSFLVWCLLGDSVQAGNHDSVEDAQSALRLWRKYREYEDAGILGVMLEDIYRTGLKYNWKRPEDGVGVGAGLMSAAGVAGRATPDVGTPSKKGGAEYFGSPIQLG